MAVSESQRKAAKKYQQQNSKTISFVVSLKYDQDIITHLETIKNKSSYLKNLIRKDINT